MTTCATCGNLGLAEDHDGIRACDCEHGAVLRTRSNAETINRYATRHHTDAIDDRTEAIRTPPAFDAVAAKLRGAGYAAPCVHLCRTCRCELQPDQPCTAMCSRCAEEEASLLPYYDPADDWLAWMFLGMVAGIVGTWGGMLLWGAL